VFDEYIRELRQRVEKTTQAAQWAQKLIQQEDGWVAVADIDIAVEIVRHLWLWGESAEISVQDGMYKVTRHKEATC
jgi:hypothetical protein